VNQGPIFKILDGPMPNQIGVSNAVTSGLAPVLSAASVAADRMPHDLPGLLLLLRRRIGGAQLAKARSGWFGGRLYNKFSGEDPDYIPVSGMHLRQVLEVAGIEAPNFVVPSDKYALRLDIASQSLAVLTQTTGSAEGQA